jgi:hypothetical protein
METASQILFFRSSAILERGALAAIQWSHTTVTYLALFALALFSLYSLVPLLMGWSRFMVFFILFSVRKY